MCFGDRRGQASKAVVLLGQALQDFAQLHKFRHLGRKRIGALRHPGDQPAAPRRLGQMLR